jgi:uncharacterized membrane protein
MFFLIAPLAFACLIISLYLIYTEKTHKRPFCILGRNCDVVIESRYAKTLGVENTVFGILYYSLLLAVLVFGLNVPSTLLIAAAGCVAIYSVYLSYLQFFVIKGFCDYCMVVNVSNWIILAILLSNP